MPSLFRNTNRVAAVSIKKRGPDVRTFNCRETPWRGLKKEATRGRAGRRIVRMRPLREL